MGDTAPLRLAPAWVQRPPWWAVVLVTLVLLGARWDDVRALGDEGRDLQQDVLAAQRLASGDELYTPFTVDEVVALGTSGVGITVNAHPPTAAVLALPWRDVPFPTTAVAWSAASLAALAAAMWLATRQAGLPVLFWVTPLLAWWFPVALHVRWGQWSTFLLLAAVVAWIGIEEDRPLLAGAALALGGAIKVVPLVLVVVPARRRQWRAVGWTAGLTAAAVAVAEVLAPTSWLGFVERSGLTTDAYAASFGNGSILGLASKAFEGSSWIDPVVDLPALVPPLWLVGSLAAAGAAALVLWRSDDAGLQVGAVVAAALLLSPVTWRHADVVLLLPAVVLVSRPLPRRRLALRLLGSGAALSLVDHLSFTTAHRAAAEGDPLGWPALLEAPGTAVLALVLAACVVAAPGPRWAARHQRAAAVGAVDGEPGQRPHADGVPPS